MKKALPVYLYLLQMEAFTKQLFTKALFSIFVLLLFSYQMKAQVSLTATAGTTTGDYTTLKTCFDAINAGTHQGVIAISMTGSTTETASAVLNASGSGSASYSSIVISPSGGAARTISGSIAGSLITLNGADNITIDGLNSNGNALTIDNASTSTAAAAVTFSATASNNTLTNCSVLGSAAFSSSSGVIKFTGTSSSYVSITNCEIGPSGSNRPSAGIISSTSSSGATNITIDNCRFHDIYNTNGGNTDITAAIIVGYYFSSNVTNSDWSITNNSFYYTSSVNATGGTIIGIYLFTKGTGFTVTGNYYGGSEPLCGGSAMTITGTPYITGFLWAYGHPSGRTIPNTGSNIISGNVISNISITSSNTSCPTNSSGGSRFIACSIYSGNWEISGNTLGSMSSNDNIILTDSNTTGYHFFHVYGWYDNVSGPNVTSFDNNKIGGITINSTSVNTSVDYGIYLLYCWYSNTNYYSKLTNITNNTFGSSLTNSIYAPNLSNVGAAGFVHLNSSDALTTVSGNTFQHMNVSSLGLYLFRNSIPVSFSNNSIQHCTGGTNIYGTMASGSTTSASTYNANLIADLKASGAIYGLWTGYGPGASNPLITFSNNIVELGADVSANIPIYGIYQYYKASAYYNTIYITGTGTSGTSNSYAYYKHSSWYDATVLKNNIFNNSRSNSGGTGTHYGCYIGTTSGPNTLDYNDYFASGTGGKIGYYSSDISSLPNANLGSHSVNTNPLFANAGSSTTTGYFPSASLVAVTSTGITTDYFGITRNASTPAMGALEYSKIWTGSADNDWSNVANWSPGLPISTDYVTFSSTASNDLLLDQDREVGGINFNGSSHKIILGTYNLTTGRCYNTSSQNYLQTNSTGLVKSSVANGSSFTFPAGNSAFNPLTITNNTGASDVFSVGVIDEVFENGSSGASITGERVQRTWNITKSTANSGSGVNLVFNWNNGEATSSFATAKLLHFDGTNWGRQAGGTMGANSFSYSGYTGSFSPFAIADDAYLLPVTITSFQAFKKSKKVQLLWTSVSEMDIIYYEVQYSNNGIDWQTAGRVQATGNGTLNQQYNFFHNTPNEGINYYRLAIKNADSKISWSKVVTVLFEKKEMGIHVYPTLVTNGLLNIYLTNPARVSVFDNSGRQVWQKQLSAGLEQINISSLSKGIYYIKTTDDIVRITVQ